MVLFQQLYDEQPRDPFPRSGRADDAGCRLNKPQSGKVADALDAFQQARLLTERLVQRNPLVSEYRAELAEILKHLAAKVADRPGAAIDTQAKDLLVQLAHDIRRSFYTELHWPMHG